MFDHGWADAWERAGGDYYPKLQIAVPFTPVPGRRLLTERERSGPGADRRRRGGGRRSNGLSSAHATFIAAEEVAAVRARRLADPRSTASSTGTIDGYGGFRRLPRRLCRRASARRSARSGRAALDGPGDPSTSPAPRSRRRIGTPSGPSTRTPARANGAAPISPARFFSLLGERLADRILLIFALRRRAADRRRAQPDRRRRALRPLLGQRSRRCRTSISRSAIIRRSRRRSRAACRGSRRAPRARTSCAAAIAPVPTWSAHYIADPRLPRRGRRFPRRRAPGGGATRSRRLPK